MIAALLLFLTVLLQPSVYAGGGHGMNEIDCDHLAEEGEEESTDKWFNLKVAAIFIVLISGLLGTALPIFCKTSNLKLNGTVFQTIKAFGIGVILSVAYVHLFPSANTLLSHPCLGSVWNEKYTSFAGLFAMISTLLIHLINIIAINHVRKAVKPVTDQEHAQAAANIEVGAVNLAGNSCCVTDKVVLMRQELHGHAQLISWLLELGIALHSIVVGITLGVEMDDSFVSLLIAITFHQFFEGIALSSTIVDAGFPSMSKPMMMAGIYAVVAPVGIVIGLLISSGETSKISMLLMSGIFNAVSVGILLYDVLVNMITASITHSEQFIQMSATKKATIIVSLWIGAGLMSILGLWA